jgi:GxxExxY protein
MSDHFAEISPDVERLATSVVDAAFAVHRALGPGLLESTYEVCQCHELSKRAVPFARQRALPVVYDRLRLDAGLRLDLLVDERLIVELKAVEQMIPLYDAQMLTYLKLTD